MAPLLLRSRLLHYLLHFNLGHLARARRSENSRLETFKKGRGRLYDALLDGGVRHLPPKYKMEQSYRRSVSSGHVRTPWQQNDDVNAYLQANRSLDDAFHVLIHGLLYRFRHHLHLLHKRHLKQEFRGASGRGTSFTSSCT